MADEPPLRPMQDKGNAASGALELEAAIPAQEVPEVPPSIDQEDNLFGYSQGLLDGSLES
jgi:hypothetical protein